MSIKKRWIDFLYNTSTSTKKIRNLLTPIGVIIFGTFSFLFVFTPLFILANYWELTIIEEPELLKRLGEEYKFYKEKTPMFFPRLNQIFGIKL